MIKKKLFRILLIFLFLFNFNFAYGKFENKIIVKVDKGIITTHDVQNEIKIFMFLNNIQPSKKNILETKNRVIKALINRELKRNEIKKYNIKKYNQIDLNDYLIRVAKNKGLSLKSLRDEFEKNNLGFDNFVDNIKIDFIWNSLIFNLYENQLNVNIQEVERELEIIKKNKKNNKNFNLSEIIINNVNEKDLIEIYDFIKQKSFEDAVVKYSNSSSAINGGKIGWIYDYELNEKYLSELKNMEIGEISKPIMSAGKIIILKLNNLKVGFIDNLDDQKQKKEILNAMKNKKLKFFSLSHFTKIENAALIIFQ